MLHLTSAEQSIIQNCLIDCVQFISEGVNRDYIVDLELSKDVVVSIDCQKHEATVNFKGVEFDIKSDNCELSLVPTKNNVTTEEYDLMMLFRKQGKEKLKEKFLAELVKRDEIHANIIGEEQAALEKKAKLAAKKVIKNENENSVLERFNAQFEAVKDALGFTTKHTVVKMDAHGTITLYQDTENKRIRLEEVVKSFSGKGDITHTYVYDTILKHKSYTVNGKHIEEQNIYVSLDCSVDFKRAIDTMSQVLDELIDDVDPAIHERLDSLFVPNDVLNDNKEVFNNFKKTTVE